VRTAPLLLLLALPLLGLAGPAAAQEVGPVISGLLVDGRRPHRITGGRKVTIVGSNFETGKDDPRAAPGAGRTVTVDGLPARVTSADDDEVEFVVPHEVLPGPARLRLAIVGRGVAETSFVVRRAANEAGMTGCVDMYYYSWVDDPGLPEDPPDPAVAEAAFAAFQITRFERVPGAAVLEVEGTCGDLPDGWPLQLHLRRDGVLQVTVGLVAEDQRWRARLGPHAAAGRYEAELHFELGQLDLPEARDFRLGNAAARQGLYDRVDRTATLELP